MGIHLTNLNSPYFYHYVFLIHSLSFDWFHLIVFATSFETDPTRARVASISKLMAHFIWLLTLVFLWGPSYPGSLLQNISFEFPPGHKNCKQFLGVLHFEKDSTRFRASHLIQNGGTIIWGFGFGLTARSSHFEIGTTRA